jgi:hypothetical protein
MSVKRWIVGSVAVVLLGGALYVWLTLTWSYSSGERVGYV